MKKKIKKIPLVKKLKNEIAVLNEKVRIAQNDVSFYKDICHQIRRMFKPPVSHTFYVSREEEVLVDQLPARIREMRAIYDAYRQHNEGAERHIATHNNDLKNIIRWLIKPKTAEQQTYEERLLRGGPNEELKR